MQKITIIIPTYKREKLLNSIINQLLCEKELIKKIIVINTSKDDVNVPNSNLITIFYNSNLLKGKNKAIKMVKTPWVLFLDDDIKLGKNTLSHFIRMSKKLNFDASSGLLIQDYAVKNIFLKTVFYGRLTFFKVGSLNYKNLYSKKPYQADFLPGGFLFVKTRSILKVGGFDSNYLLPFFNEDTDLSVRLKALKCKLMILPSIKAYHLKWKSGGVRKKINLRKWYYAFGFNNSYFIIKNYSVLYYLYYSCFNLRDHLHVIKQFNLAIFVSYLRGIFYGYKKSQG